MWRLSRFSCRFLFFLFVGCQRKKCREFYFFAARSILSIDSFIHRLTHTLTHSFIHSFSLLWLWREPFQFRFWVFGYGPNFISFPDIEPKQLSSPTPTPTLTRTQTPFRLKLLGHLSNFQSHIWYCHARFFPSFLFILLHRNRKGLSDRVTLFFLLPRQCVFLPFLKIASYPSVSCRRCGLRAGCDKSET